MSAFSSPKVELPGTVAMAIEISEEARVQRQARRPATTGLALPGMATRATKRAEPELPSGGRLDILLASGCSLDLAHGLVKAFRNDEPEDSGRTNGRTAGLSCSYKGSYCKEVFSPKAVVDHLSLASCFWKPEPTENVVDLSVADDSQLVIVGDTHGQLEDVLWIFFKYGWPSEQNRYLFNGDIVDRGGHAVEILLLLFAIKRDCPESLEILRGNHEDTNCTIHYGFKMELEAKFAEHLSAVWNVCTTSVFPLLPIAAVCTDVLNGYRIAVVHGGIPVDLPGYPPPVSLEEELRRVDRQRPTVQKLPVSDQGRWEKWERLLEGGQLLYNFMWADPAETQEAGIAGHREKNSSNSRAGKFLESDSREFCERNGITLLVRSHEVPRTLRGIMANHSGLCLTVFSASNYCGSVGNRGGVLVLRPSMRRSPALEAFEHWAPPWPQLCSMLGAEGLRQALAERRKHAEQWELSFGISQKNCFLGELPDPFASAVSVPSEESLSASREQLMQYMAERIVEHKEELFEEFCRVDDSCSGMVNISNWLEVMMKVFSHRYDIITTAVLGQLSQNWKLAHQVVEVKFLYRFQIRDNPEDGSVLIDRIKIVTQLQSQLVDFSAINLEHLLDPNGDKAVSHREFAKFLPQFHIKVPPWQAAALYATWAAQCRTKDEAKPHFGTILAPLGTEETMASMVDQDPINLDNTILCLALVSQDPPKPEDDPCADVAEAIGQKILQSGTTLAGIFRSWDQDKSGFLSLVELNSGLQTLSLSHSFSDAEVSACMTKIDSLGKEDQRISIFEFIRALAPRHVTLELQRSMIREVLKRVWVCRPTLLSALGAKDPDATNKVDWDAFHDCVREVNDAIHDMGLPVLTPTQIQVVCEIAAAGREDVKYNEFVLAKAVSSDHCARPPCGGHLVEPWGADATGGEQLHCVAGEVGRFPPMLTLSSWYSSVSEAEASDFVVFSMGPLHHDLQIPGQDFSKPESDFRFSQGSAVILQSISAKVGNKRDLKEVSFLEASRFAQEKDILFLETSALTGENVQDVFHTLAQRILNKVEEGICDIPESRTGGQSSSDFNRMPDRSDRPRGAGFCRCGVPRCMAG
ncbi:unnamed protein product [Cladocopium goreaui]|uniref:Serine/threonine-protein phosphatase n=1 Tax=Cladocopium goreaui TaxID=2562237 RepID=A0A9P1FKH7_9DINO|nr:unnamed protein product [Cladocopium goreaui]